MLVRKILLRRLCKRDGWRTKSTAVIRLSRVTMVIGRRRSRGTKRGGKRRLLRNRDRDLLASQRMARDIEMRSKNRGMIER
jgi:hypothetical protein